MEEEFKKGKECNKCSVKFSFRKYRYHCSACKLSFCHQDSNFYVEISKKKLRFCEPCYFENVRLHESPMSEALLDESQLITPNLEQGSPKAESIVKDSIALEDLCSLDDKNFKVELRICSYNVWMMPNRVTAFASSVSPNKMERAMYIALSLPKCDVVVFQEAFCIETRNHLLQAMAQMGYIYQSAVVGRVESTIRPLDGGVVLVSKYEIVSSETRKFGRCCVGDDRFADKGILYAVIRKENQNIHVFSTHTQAWNYKKAVLVRHQQLELLHQYIKDKNIHKREIVLVVGDFNVDKWNPVCDIDGVSYKEEESIYIQNEYKQMLSTLQCREPEYTQLDKQKYSFDASRNKLAAPGLSSDGTNELIDYILYSTHHRQPKQSTCYIAPIQSTASWIYKRNGKKVAIKDLSDHYPIIASYHF